VIETNEPTAATRESEMAPDSDLAQVARDAGTAAQERLGDLKDAARASLDDARSTATEKAGEAKDQAADEIARTARGLQAAAEQMEGSPLQQDLLREAADGLQQIAQAVQGKSLGRMAAELSDFGRQNPVGYLGGAALVGFALARFARASTSGGESFGAESQVGRETREPQMGRETREPAVFGGGWENG